MTLLRFATLLLISLSSSACCSLLFDFNSSDDGVIVEDDSRGLQILLDKIDAIDSKLLLYNPDKVKFVTPPRLDKPSPRVQVKEIKGAKTDPTRLVPEEADVVRRSIDLGWRLTRAKMKSARRTVVIEIQNLDRDKNEPPEKLKVTFKLQRYAFNMRMYNLAYDEVVLPNDEEYKKGGPPPVWIRKVGPLRKLHIREMTSKTLFHAFVADKDFENSSFQCPRKIGVAIFRKSTPIFNELYQEIINP